MIVILLKVSGVKAILNCGKQYIAMASSINYFIKSIYLSVIKLNSSGTNAERRTAAR